MIKELSACKNLPLNMIGVGERDCYSNFSAMYMPYSEYDWRIRVRLCHSPQASLYVQLRR